MGAAPDRYTLEPGVFWHVRRLTSTPNKMGRSVSSPPDCTLSRCCTWFVNPASPSRSNQQACRTLGVGAVREPPAPLRLSLRSLPLAGRGPRRRRHERRGSLATPRRLLVAHRHPASGQRRQRQHGCETPGNEPPAHEPKHRDDRLRPTPPRPSRSPPAAQSPSPSPRPRRASPA